MGADDQKGADDRFSQLEIEKQGEIGEQEGEIDGAESNSKSDPFCPQI